MDPGYWNTLYYRVIIRRTKRLTLDFSIFIIQLPLLVWYIEFFIYLILLCVSVYACARVCVCLYTVCPESFQPFWISRDSAALLFGDQKEGIYYTCVNRHSPVVLLSQQWDAIERACAFCDRRVHSEQIQVDVSRLVLELFVFCFLAKRRISQAC